MLSKRTDFSPEWKDLLEQIQTEMINLAAEEKEWLCSRVAAINDIQTSLNELFSKAGGEVVCAVCGGECCGCGRHHVTLTNLLAYFLAGEIPPEPDFGKTCPFLEKEGCLFPVVHRPYNCITFFCERLEENLGSQDRDSLRELDQQLRYEYQAVADRYPAASLRGLWIALGQHDDEQILRSKKPDMLK